MSDLPYATPQAETDDKVGVDLDSVFNASRRADRWALREEHGLMPYLSDAVLLGGYFLGAGYADFSLIADYPVVHLDSITIDDVSLDLTDVRIEGETIYVQTRSVPNREFSKVRAAGLFGWARRIPLAAVRSGQTLAADATEFGNAFSVSVIPQAGQAFLINDEQLYHDGTALVRGANGMSATAHVADSALYRLELPQDVQQDVRIAAKYADSMEQIARNDRSGDRGEQVAQKAARVPYTFERFRPKFNV